MPKVRRSVPTIGSVPISASMTPNTAIKSAFVAEPEPRAAVAMMPRAASRNISGGPNSSAASLIASAAAISTKMLQVPPMKDPTAATLSAEPALPWRASLYPSIVVIPPEDSPGTLISAEVSVPPYMAPYMMPDSMTIAVTGSMPKETGSSSAIPSDGPMPGSAPITWPSSTPTKTARRLPGVAAVAKPSASNPRDSNT